MNMKLSFIFLALTTTVVLAVADIDKSTVCDCAQRSDELNCSYIIALTPISISPVFVLVLFGAVARTIVVTPLLFFFFIMIAFCIVTSKLTAYSTTQ